MSTNESQVANGAIKQFETKIEIMERLNLHVKKRLQQEQQQQQQFSDTQNIAATSPPKKSRKPYQKRVPNNSNNAKSQQTAVEKTTTPTSKRQKLKKFDESIDHPPHTSLTVVTGDDDVSLDGTADPILRSPHSRDKEKYPDVLGLVLNSKKRSLMQDPEVQQFFTQIFEAFRN